MARSGFGSRPRGYTHMSIDDDTLEFTAADERRMAAQLEDTEYDTELGLELAKDAQRVVAGDLDEETFRARYHDAVMAEFGEDERQLGEMGELDEEVVDTDVPAEGTDAGGLRESLSALADGEGDLSRREVRKKGGFAAAALTVFAGLSDDDRAGSAESAAVDDEDRTQWGMVINLDNCDGCLVCMTACAQENDTSAGANWMYVFTYEDDHQQGENFLVRPCQHCSKPPARRSVRSARATPARRTDWC